MKCGHTLQQRSIADKDSVDKIVFIAMGRHLLYVLARRLVGHVEHSW